jgi:phytoene dehydrogenase-like protein
VKAALGEIGLPAPVSELAGRAWDAIIVGGGHNGLTAAAYLSRAGRSVLVLERRERLGGACTLERPFPDPGYLVSPCAYVVGLLDETVISELGLRRHGYRVFSADPNLWCPFPDGTSYAQFLDDDRTVAHMRENGFSDPDIRGSLAYEEMFDRLRRRLRRGRQDAWRAPSPSRRELEEMLDGDEELISVLFEESIAETLERYVRDERLKHALFGQGVIGAWAGPRSPGTASVKLMHFAGELNGEGGVWGYVEGGMGRISFAIAAAAAEAGAVLATGVPVARILPGEGVELESGDRLRAPVIVCNADPKRMLAMLEGTGVPEDYRERLQEWDVRSPVVKVNAALGRLPTWTAAGGVEPERAMISVTPGIDAAQQGFEACERGDVAIGFCELYFQTAYDRSTAPVGKHTMSCFCQYAPYELASGDWDARRDEVGGMVLDTIAEYAPDVHDCVEYLDVLGPPEIERRIGLTGGNIFQGATMPSQMWENRLEARTPIEGLYLCGAATHPAGSVIALNGRNAALAVLADAAGSGPVAD